jgi:ComF family protein
MPFKRNTLSVLADLVLPRRCAGCDQALLGSERDLCRTCLDDLPRARMLDDATNPVARLFWGRVPLEAAGAVLQFRTGGKVQHLLHRLKYKGDRHVGLALGRIMGAEAAACTHYAGVDTAMAVPLHPRKERTRGFNQAQVLVDGLLECWPLKPATGGLLRVLHTSSQTKRSRWDRWLNVQEAFTTMGNELVHGAHILLVDDVVTTGATLEGCANALLKLPGVKVSVLTAAHA